MSDLYHVIDVARAAGALDAAEGSAAAAALPDDAALPHDADGSAAAALRALVQEGIAVATPVDGVLRVSLTREALAAPDAKRRAKLAAVLGWAWLAHHPAVDDGAAARVDDANGNIDAILERQSAAKAAQATRWPSPAGLAAELKARGLAPTLRPYQLAAVEWMRSREAVECGPVDARDAAWLRCGPDGDGALWFNGVTGHVVEALQPDLLPREINGGILADEMGLGKTVVVLALALLNHTPAPAPPLGEDAPPRSSETRLGALCQSDDGAAVAPRLYDAACVCGALDGLAKVHCVRCGRGIHAQCCAAGVAEDTFVCVACDIFQAIDRVRLRPQDAHCGPTLVVAPTAIISQWQSEAARHAPALRLRRYDGVRALSNARATKATRRARLAELSPATLSNEAFDVVLTSYDVLRAELAHARPAGGAVRARYAFVASPLLGVVWDRVVLDEAQMCESSTAACAKVALALAAKTRWAVTGTPVGRGRAPLEDLFGLAAFLRVSPYDDKAWWRAAVANRSLVDGGAAGLNSFPGRLARALLGRFAGRCVWRATKRLVGNQLGLPPQASLEKRLHFTDEERFFYDKQLAAAKADVQAALAKAQRTQRKKPRSDEAPQRDDGEPLEHDDAALQLDFAGPLLRVRQACCHPSVGANDKYFLTLDQVLNRLATEAKFKYEEAHRLAVMQRCGLAALTVLQGDLRGDGRKRRDAIAQYVAVLRDVDARRDAVELLGDVEVQGSDDLEASSGDASDGASRGLISRGRATRLAWRASAAAGPSWARFDCIGDASAKDASLQGASSSRRVVRVDLALVAATDGAAPLRVALQALRDGVFETFGHVILTSNALVRTECSERLRALRLLLEPHVGGVALDVRIFEATVDTDAYQEMHAACNLGRALARELREPDEGNAGVAGNDAGVETRLGKAAALDCETYRAARSHVAVAPRFMLETLAADAAGRVDRVVQRGLRTTRALRGREVLALAEATADADAAVRASGSATAWCAARHDTDSLDRALAHAFEQRGLSGDARRGRWTDAGAVAALVDSTRGDALARRTALLRELRKLSDSPSEEEQLENSRCGKCRLDFLQTGPTCRHCALEQKIDGYGRDLRFFAAGKADAMDAVKAPDALAAAAVAAVAAWAKAGLRRVGASSAEACALRGCAARCDGEVSLRGALLREYESARKFWRRHFDLLSELDHLRMAQTPMQLFLGDAVEHALMDAQVRAAHVLPAVLDDDVSESANALVLKLDDLRNARSKFAHLLRRVEANDAAGADEADSTADADCAVCHEVMQLERAVLTRCGHSFCAECVRGVAKSAGHAGLRCPTCRAWHTLEDVAFPLALRQGTASRHVRRFGTKVAALAQDVAALKPGDQCLIFAEWDSMLELVSRALDEFGVRHARPRGRADWDTSLAGFRGDAGVRALLLNVKTAAAGLTLVEANHCFLLHPLLSTATERQAVGRVHRIGQTKPTTVQRYVIADTVEETLHALAQQRAAAAAEYIEADTAASQSPPASPSKKRRRAAASGAARAAAEAVQTPSDLRAIFRLAD
ncbi:SNF2 family N-terminal domain-containing protein [Pelagophyceae sp. CCMP2097]|nr:SNF2 family N-terminal domain-containing protein [Pelagophyceae sp. CCMP2097]